MGKSIVVLGADFSENAIGKIPEQVEELFGGSQNLWPTLPEITMSQTATRSVFGILSTVTGKVVASKCLSSTGGRGRLLINSGTTSTNKGDQDFIVRQSDESWVKLDRPMDIQQGDFIGFTGSQSGAEFKVGFTDTAPAGGRVMYTYSLDNQSYTQNTTRTFSFALLIEVDES